MEDEESVTVWKMSGISAQTASVPHKNGFQKQSQFPDFELAVSFDLPLIRSDHYTPTCTRCSISKLFMDILSVQRTMVPELDTTFGFGLKMQSAFFQPI